MKTAVSTSYPKFSSAAPALSWVSWLQNAGNETANSLFVDGLNYTADQFRRGVQEFLNEERKKRGEEQLPIIRDPEGAKILIEMSKRCRQDRFDLGPTVYTRANYSRNAVRLGIIEYLTLLPRKQWPDNAKELLGESPTMEIDVPQAATEEDGNVAAHHEESTTMVFTVIVTQKGTKSQADGTLLPTETLLINQTVVAQSMHAAVLQAGRSDYLKGVDLSTVEVVVKTLT